MWHTGPKIPDCYIYDHNVTNTWVKVAELDEPRVYAQTVNLGDGRLMIIGGLGEEGILSSAEVLSYDNVTNKWTVEKGRLRMPLATLGHCVVKRTRSNSYSFVGGFDGRDYTDAIHTLNLAKMIWVREPSGLTRPRMDHGCWETEDGDLVVAGGWNRDGLVNSTEVISAGGGRSLNETEVTHQGEDFAAVETFNMRRSGISFHNAGKPVMLGGAACSVDERMARECKKFGSSLQFQEEEKRWTLAGNWSYHTTFSSASIIPIPESHICG